MLPGAQIIHGAVAPDYAPLGVTAEGIQILHGLDEKVSVVNLKKAAPDAWLFHGAYRCREGRLPAVLSSPAAHVGEGHGFSLTPCAGKTVFFRKNDDIVKMNRLKSHGSEIFW